MFSESITSNNSFCQRPRSQSVIMLPGQQVEKKRLVYWCLCGIRKQTSFVNQYLLPGYRASHAPSVNMTPLIRASSRNDGGNTLIIFIR